MYARVTPARATRRGVVVVFGDDITGEGGRRDRGTRGGVFMRLRLTGIIIRAHTIRPPFRRRREAIRRTILFLTTAVFFSECQARLIIDPTGPW